jgi:hypothetical protein
VIIKHYDATRELAVTNTVTLLTPEGVDICLHRGKLSEGNITMTVAEADRLIEQLLAARTMRPLLYPEGCAA